MCVWCAVRARQDAEKARLEEERRQRNEVADAQSKKQRQREEEIEAKQQRREEEARQAMEERQQGRSRGDDGGWRKEEPERPTPQRW